MTRNDKIHLTIMDIIQSNCISSNKNNGAELMFLFNPLQPGVAFLYAPKNIRKTKGFLMFSGVIEKQHGVVMGYYWFITLG